VELINKNFILGSGFVGLFPHAPQKQFSQASSPPQAQCLTSPGNSAQCLLLTAQVSQIQKEKIPLNKFRDENEDKTTDV